MKAKEFLNKVMRGDKTTIKNNVGLIGFDEKLNHIVAEEDKPDETNYLCFTAEEDGAEIIVICKDSSGSARADLKYSTDKKNWTQLEFTETETSGTYSSDVITLGLGDKVYFKGNNPNGLGDQFETKFDISNGKIAASGDIDTLLNEVGGEDFDLSPFGDYAFYELFKDCTAMTSAPALPATILADNCYDNMFSGCTSLMVAPTLPATTLAESCYYSMFIGCELLTSAPTLPATNLAKKCYSFMFSGCKTMQVSPALPATALVEECYKKMFSNCWALNSVIVGATSWDASAANDWLFSVQLTGTFTKPSATEIPEGDSGIPTGWTVHDI